MTNIYRKIYEKQYGPIPIDDNNRSYEIHHIDGNHNNNDISNLKCVSIQEHYNIHYSQQDWAACNIIGKRLKISPEILSNLLSMSQKKLVDDGVHHFLGSEINKKYSRINQLRRVKEGIHHFQNREWQRSNQLRRVNDGTHNFVGNSNPYYKQLMDGNHPSQTQRTCPYCNKTGGGGAMLRFHFDRCKSKN